MIRKILTSVVILPLSFYIVFVIGPTQQAYAVSGLPFGGLDVTMVPCTCTGGALMWHFFTPLYLGTAVPTAGALVYFSSGTVLFPYYALLPSVWALGFYTPGAGTGCLIGVAPYCTLLPNLGFISPETGVSL